MIRLEVEKRADLSSVLRDARARTRWSQDEAAEKATAALRRAAETEQRISREERVLWLKLEVTRHHVATLENCPAAPLSAPERRAYLLGLVLALGVDRGLINRLAGGI